MTEEQIIRLYGERCAEHCDDCCVCEVWAMHDLIETQAREIERLREALEIAQDYKDCGCSYDNPNDICLGHLKLFERLNARAALGESHDQ